MKKLQCNQCGEQTEYKQSKFYCLCGGVWEPLGEAEEITFDGLEEGDYFCAEERGHVKCKQYCEVLGVKDSIAGTHIIFNVIVTATDSPNAFHKEIKGTREYWQAYQNSDYRDLWYASKEEIDMYKAIIKEENYTRIS